jgi:hypothetical protein
VEFDKRHDDRTPERDLFGLVTTALLRLSYISPHCFRFRHGALGPEILRGYHVDSTCVESILGRASSEDPGKESIMGGEIFNSEHSINT